MLFPNLFPKSGLQMREPAETAALVNAPGVEPGILYLAYNSPIVSPHATCRGQIGFRREADCILRRCQLQPEL